MRSLACLFLVACAGAGDAQTDETEVDADATADGADPSVRAGDTTLSVSRDVTRRGDTFVLRGKTSRNLTGGTGFVIDDPYGTFAIKSPRVFELSWGVSEIRSLADGIDQLIGLDFVHSSSRPDHLTGKVVVRPRLTGFTGSSKIYLTAELTPVVVGGETIYRIAGHSTDANTGVRFLIDGTDTATVNRADATHFTIDLAPDQAIAATTGSDLDVIVAFPTGGVEKHAHLGLSIKKLGMTSDDPEKVWPRPTCTTALRSCLLALPGDDLAACGDAIQVTACRGTVGTIVDDVAIQTALHQADTTLAGAHDDAVGLADAARADAFLVGAKHDVEATLQPMLGRWFLTATGKDAAVAGALANGLDTAYARPLDLIEAAPVVPADAAKMRQVVADAVLAELARMDFVHTEFGRSLESLVHDFRDQHVTSIRAFRETVTAEPYPGSTVWDVYIGDWLGCHTEVVVERATGAIVSTLVEID